MGDVTIWGNELVDWALQHYEQNEHYPAWCKSRAELNDLPLAAEFLGD
jgi:hypothetical protein